jgi:hypothetical protein
MRFPIFLLAVSGRPQRLILKALQSTADVKSKAPSDFGVQNNSKSGSSNK